MGKIVEAYHRLFNRDTGKGRGIQNYRIDPVEAPALCAQTDNELAKIFYNNEGRLVHKWLHYLDVYEERFSKYRGTPVKMLEIGVSLGGSLDMWRRYFGPDATIFGIDIDPACADRVTAPNQVRIGSQDDTNFLAGVLEEIGTPDIILDDGSHIGRHQQASFEFLFPKLADGGLYVIEDMHTAYWPGFFEGGFKRSTTAIEFLKRLVDEQHGYYHTRTTNEYYRDNIKAVAFYDSIAVIEKKRRGRLGHIRIRPPEEMAKLLAENAAKRA